MSIVKSFNFRCKQIAVIYQFATTQVRGFYSFSFPIIIYSEPAISKTGNQWVLPKHGIRGGGGGGVGDI